MCLVVVAGVKRFDQNLLRELGADSHSNIANLADDICVLGEQANLLFLAKPHFTQPVLDLWRRGKLLDAHVSAGTNVTQWADERLRTFRVRLNHNGTVVHVRLTVG